LQIFKAEREALERERETGLTPKGIDLQQKLAEARAAMDEERTAVSSYFTHEFTHLTTSADQNKHRAVQFGRLPYPSS
jgi:hypothetical protein